MDELLRRGRSEERYAQVQHLTSHIFQGFDKICHAGES